jgi:hypothetical protein
MRTEPLIATDCPSPEREDLLTEMLLALFLATVLALVLWRVTGFHAAGDHDHRFVRIDEDGNAWELTTDEREYLNTKFDGADGAPYIKSRYGERNGWKKLNGFLLRSRVPKRIRIRKS